MHTCDLLKCLAVGLFSYAACCCARVLRMLKQDGRTGLEVATRAPSTLAVIQDRAYTHAYVLSDAVNLKTRVVLSY